MGGLTGEPWRRAGRAAATTTVAGESWVLSADAFSITDRLLLDVWNREEGLYCGIEDSRRADLRWGLWGTLGFLPHRRVSNEGNGPRKI